MKFLSTTTYVLTTLALSMGANAYSDDDACSSVYRPVCCAPVAGTWTSMQTYPNEDCARVDGADLNTCSDGPCNDELDFLSMGSDSTTDELDFMDSGVSFRCNFPDRSTRPDFCGPNEFCALAVGTCPSYRGTQRGTCTPTRNDVSANWDPVCGCNDRTYPNLSAADAAGVNVRSYGRCRRDSFSSTSKSSKKRRSSTTTSKSSKKRRSSSSTSKSSKTRMEFAYE